MDNPTMFSFFASSQTYISAKITFIGARVILWPKVRGARQGEETGHPQVVFWWLVGQDVTQWSCGLPQKLKPLIRKPDTTHTLHELCSSMRFHTAQFPTTRISQAWRHADAVQWTWRSAHDTPQFWVRATDVLMRGSVYQRRNPLCEGNWRWASGWTACPGWRWHPRRKAAGSPGAPALSSDGRGGVWTGWTCRLQLGPVWLWKWGVTVHSINAGREILKETIYQ